MLHQFLLLKNDYNNHILFSVGVNFVHKCQLFVQLSMTLLFLLDKPMFITLHTNDLINNIILYIL